jgi:hypothetical protein
MAPAGDPEGYHFPEKDHGPYRRDHGLQKEEWCKRADWIAAHQTVPGTVSHHGHHQPQIDDNQQYGWTTLRDGTKLVCFEQQGGKEELGRGENGEPCGDRAPLKCQVPDKCLTRRPGESASENQEHRTISARETRFFGHDSNAGKRQGDAETPSQPRFLPEGHSAHENEKRHLELQQQRGNRSIETLQSGEGEAVLDGTSKDRENDYLAKRPVWDRNKPDEDQGRKRESEEHQEDGRKASERAFHHHHAGAPDDGNEHASEAVGRGQSHESSRMSIQSIFVRPDQRYPTGP